jgi:hypothetical protein
MRQLIFADAKFREVAIGMFPYEYDQSKDEASPFQSSAGFVNVFKSRHGFTSRRIHYKWQSAVTEE